MAMTPKLRYQVLRRDGFTCQYCGGTAPDVRLQVDHIEPRKKGGRDHPENLLTSCSRCNGAKAASDLPGIGADTDVRRLSDALSLVICRLQIIADPESYEDMSTIWSASDVLAAHGDFQVGTPEWEWAQRRIRLLAEEAEEAV